MCDHVEEGCSNYDGLGKEAPGSRLFKFGSSINGEE